MNIVQFNLKTVRWNSSVIHGVEIIDASIGNTSASGATAKG